MTPPELCLASLGACAGYYAAEYLHHHKLAEEGTRVDVSAGKAKNPARLDDFHIAVTVPAHIEARHREGLERAVRKCLIHNTLTHPPRISLEIRDQPA